MLGYLIDDFCRELHDFIIDPKMEREQEKAKCQLEEFRNRFPLKRLQRMSPEEFRDSKGGKDDFCHWITDGTSVVTNRLAWAKVKLGIARPRNYYGYHRGAHRTIEWRDEVRDSLVQFLRHYGLRWGDGVEQCFGQPLLLKLLYLYYPEDFINIASVGWIDKIVYTFALDYGSTIYERSHTVREFYEKVSRQVRPLESSCFRNFLNEYLGLSNNCDDYLDFLTKGEGLSAHAAERFARSLRQMSRLLLGFGLSKKSLFVWSIDELHEGPGRFFPQLRERAKCSLRKLDDFGKAFDLYLSYMLSRGASLRRQSFSMAGKIRPPVPIHYVEAKQKPDDKKKTKDWVKELQDAKSAEEVAIILQVSGSVHPFYRHYTTLSSFLCMSDEWVFRLTRGDDPGMNDQLEWKRLGDAKLWKRTFISSFSCVEGESAAMWGLYGKPSNEALRLSFDHKTMSSWMDTLRGGRGKPQVQFFGVDGMPGDVVEVGWKDVEVLFGDILYGGKVSGGADRESGYIFQKAQLNGTAFSGFKPSIDKAVSMTGFIKSADWAYEEEARVIIRLNEKTQLPKGRSMADVQYVYIPIPKETLERVEFMTGPCVPKKLRPIVEDKIKSILSPSAIVSNSKYTDNLKFK